TLEYCTREGARAMKRIGGNDAALQREQLEHFQGAGCLVPAGRLLLCQRDACVHRKDVDQLQRTCTSATLVGAAQSLAVDRHHASEAETIGFGEAGHEAAEH